MRDPQKLDILYFCSSTHIARKGRVVRKSPEMNIYSFKYYLSFLVRVKDWYPPPQVVNICIILLLN